jgi:hypothetical protein
MNDVVLAIRLIALVDVGCIAMAIPAASSTANSATVISASGMGM